MLDYFRIIKVRTDQNKKIKLIKKKLENVSHAAKVNKINNIYWHRYSYLIENLNWRIF